MKTKNCQLNKPQKARTYPAGLTFIEIIIASVVLIVAVMGTSAYRYNATLDLRKAKLQTTAARTAVLLCESWCGSSDPNSFDPVTSFGSQLTIDNASDDISTPSGFTLHNAYRITIEGVDYYAVLSWKDISAGLRALNVVINWNQRGDNDADVDKSFKITNYISN